MKRKHSRVIQNLNNFFDKTKAKKANGQLICEQDVMVSGMLPAGIQLRRPSLAYFTNEQIRSDENDEPIPAFCIEVISTFDKINEIKIKLREYFKNGVKVVWLIMPDQDMVESLHIFERYNNLYKHRYLFSTTCFR